MKRIIISIAIAIILGTQSTAQQSGTPDFFANLPPLQPKIFHYEDPLPDNSSKDTEKEKQMKKLLETMIKQLEIIEKIHQSITGSRRINGILSTDIADQYLKTPELIYNRDKQYEKYISSDTSIISEMLMEQNLEPSKPSKKVRKLIEERTEYSAIMAKAISLQVFEEVENRFKRITKHLIDLKLAKDLKTIAEMQAYIKGTLAMIQNEATKLQMVTHLYEAEQELINLQKYKYNMRILNSGVMPTIKYDTTRPIR